MRKVITVAIAIGTMFAALALVAPAASATDYCDDDVTTFVGSPENDRIVGTNCDDVVYGFAGDDRIRGKFGYDILRGGRDDDVISDPSFEGRINAGSGFDTCIVDADSEITVLRCENVIEV